MTSYTGRTISSSQWTEGYIDSRNNLSGSLSGNIPSPRDRICNVSPTATGAPNSFCTITCRGKEEFPTSSYKKENRPNKVTTEIFGVSHPEVEGGEKEGAKGGGGGDGEEEGGGEEEEGG
ncbi:hypothetical protein Taro_020927 [Colocasia esculenta]|uniref:Uncharacterized protein n=1 Tax=Colocasia esculenta TaxID=4460 RepID=A0A843V105_COLES|nr:hypothetical protein [Colocasia esculenta]